MIDEEIASGIKDEYGVRYSQDGKRLLQCENKKIENYSVKEGTEDIRSSAFWKCQDLKHVKLPESLRHIGPYVFADCIKLETIELSHGLISIGDYAFRSCESLTVVELPDTVISLGNGVFCDCTNMVVVKFPYSLATIAGAPFYVSPMNEKAGVTNLLSKIYVICPPDIGKYGVEKKFKRMFPKKFHDKLVITDKLPDDWKNEKPTIQKPTIQYDSPVMMYGWGGNHSTSLLLVFDPDAFKDGYMCIAIEDGYLGLDELTPQEYIEKNCSGLKYVDSYIKEDEDGMRYIFAQVDENAVKHGRKPILDYLISGYAAGEFRVKVYFLTPNKKDASRYAWKLLYNEEFCCK
ncbi:MAG: leucine-rich repeat domain-containing protein [Prevotella sp.]|nr:leucine-rich repeat domain-containing protein [Prevotella sp.]